MISFLRRSLTSPLALGLFALILIAFVIVGVGTPGGLDQLGGAGGGATLAKVGGSSVTTVEATQRIQVQLDAMRQERPGLDMLEFIAAGGVERTVERMIDERAMVAVANSLGVYVGKREIDGRIASQPAFMGLTGKFDEAKFRQFLAQRRLSEAQVREDLARAVVEDGVRATAMAGAGIANRMVLPYASLLLETRKGTVAVVPSAVVGLGNPPTEAELTQYYARNTARYIVPETRVVRYAVFDRARFEQAGKPTEAEILAGYKERQSRYGPTETRGFEQVIVANEATARTIATKAAASSLSAAAKASGAEAIPLALQKKDSFANLTSAAVADAAFKASKGAIVGPIKSPLGWHVLSVTVVNSFPAKRLDQVRASLTEDLTKTKTDALIADFVADIEDQIADGASLADIVKAKGLKTVDLPALTAGGIAPSSPAYKAAPEVIAILKSAFQDEPNDDPAVVTLAAGVAYALYDLISVNTAAPRPFAAMKNQVTSDFVRDRAARSARKIAETVVAKVNKGTPIADALRETGLALPPARAIGGQRLEVAQASQGKVPPPLQLLFSMAPKRAKLIEAGGGQGWGIVYLETITPGDASQVPGLRERTQQEMAQVIGNEYTAQLMAAIRQQVGVTKNEAAIKALRKSLGGGNAAP